MTGCSKTWNGMQKRNGMIIWGVARCIVYCTDGDHTNTKLTLGCTTKGPYFLGFTLNRLVQTPDLHCTMVDDEIIIISSDEDLVFALTRLT